MKGRNRACLFTLHDTYSLRALVLQNNKFSTPPYGSFQIESRVPQTAIIALVFFIEDTHTCTLTHTQSHGKKSHIDRQNQIKPESVKKTDASTQLPIHRHTSTDKQTEKAVHTVTQPHTQTPTAKNSEKPRRQSIANTHTGKQMTKTPKNKLTPTNTDPLRI